MNAERVEETEAEIRELKSHRAVKRGEIELTDANWQNSCHSVSQADCWQAEDGHYYARIIIL